MIVCDLDGVVVNFSTGFSKLLNSMDKSLPVLENCDTPSWEWRDWYAPEAGQERLDQTIEDAWDYIKNDPKCNFWLTLTPLYPDTMERLNRVAREEPILFLTRRDGANAWEHTSLWLIKNGIEEPLVYCVRSGEEKGDVCNKLGANIIIDDSHKYADEILSHGHKLIMPIWKSNEQWRKNIKQDSNVWVVPNLDSALDTALFLSKKDKDN